MRYSRMVFSGTAALSALALALIAIPAQAHVGMDEYGQGHMHWDGYMGGWWPVHGLVGLLVLLLIVAAIVVGVRLLWGMGGGHTKPRRHDALSILDERYARGEIDRDEYLRRRTDLEG